MIKTAKMQGNVMVSPAGEARGPGARRAERGGGSPVPASPEPPG